MMEVFQGSNLDDRIDKMFTHMKTQIENPALASGRLVFNRVLFLYVSFHKLNLTRGSSYLPLPDWIANKKAVINPQNVEDGECFKWAVLMVLHHEAIGNNPEQISKLKRFKSSYHWRGLVFPIVLDETGGFEQKNMSVNILGLLGKMIYILRKSKFNSWPRMANLLLSANEKHYAMIKDLSQLLTSSNGEHQHQQHFCLNLTAFKDLTARHPGTSTLTIV